MKEEIIMETVYTNIGMLAIIFFILYLMKKINYILYQKKQSQIYENKMYIASDCVYEAAEAFAKGGTLEEVEEILLKCIAFDEDSAESIIKQAQINVNLGNEGFNSFIKCVNNELGKNVYTLNVV